MTSPAATPPATRPDDRPVWDLIFGNIAYSAMAVSHEMGLFALLGRGRLTRAAMARELNVQERPLAALLAVGVSTGLLEVEDGRYGLSEAGRHVLAEESPTYVGGFLDALRANDAVFSCDAMKRAVLANAPQVYGGDALFETHEQQVALAEAFTHGMHGHSMVPALAWPKLLDLSGCRVMLDVGGGSGAHAIGALQAYAGLRATVLDLPPVCRVAEEYARRHGVADRLQTVAADMWKDLFPAADVHFYADIFHDWPDERCLLLARKSQEALPAGGLIVLHELLFDDGGHGPLAAAAYSAAMLLWTEGRQRTAAELRALLAEVGFRDVQVCPSVGYWSIVVGRKA